MEAIRFEELVRGGKTEKEGENKCRNCENVDFMVFSENIYTSSSKHIWVCLGLSKPSRQESGWNIVPLLKLENQG